MHRCSQRGGGERAGGSNSTLPPCGQLTCCFSAVAELLVFIVLLQSLKYHEADVVVWSVSFIPYIPNMFQSSIWPNPYVFRFVLYLNLYVALG